MASEKATDLLPMLQHLAIWAERHTDLPDGGAHMGLWHESCGHETTSAETCSACGEPLRSQDMTWVKPWLDTSHRLRAAGG